VTAPSGGSGDLVPPTGSRDDDHIEAAFDRLVDEGEGRLTRPLLPLLATGFLGGFDVGIGVLAYLVVLHRTGNALLAAAVFPIGFVALLLARSELFTENFMLPVTAVVTRHGTVGQLLRLWVVSLLGNLVGGAVLAGLVVAALPDLRATAVTAGSHYAHLGVTWQSFALAVLAGAVITLMTRMQHATESLGLRIVPSLLMSFVLVAAQLFHCVLDAILMLTGLFTGHADFSWLDWLGAVGWSAVGNVVGGLVLVTSVRLLRVPHRVREERDRH
jgi:formate/nitrite transporter FocA (FNT family)